MIPPGESSNQLATIIGNSGYTTAASVYMRVVMCINVCVYVVICLCCVFVYMCCQVCFSDKLHLSLPDGLIIDVIGSKLGFKAHKHHGAPVQAWQQP